MKERLAQYVMVLAAALFGGSLSSKAAIARTYLEANSGGLSSISDSSKYYGRSGDSRQASSVWCLPSSISIGSQGQYRFILESLPPADGRSQRGANMPPAPAAENGATQHPALFLGNPLEGALSVPGGALAVGLLLLGGGIRSRHPEVYRIGKSDTAIKPV